MSDFNSPSTPPPAGTTPGHAAPHSQGTNKLAIASLVLSIGSLLVCCLPYGVFFAVLVAIIGAVLGGVAEQQIREGKGGGMGLAKAGRIIGIIASLILTVLMILTIAGISYLGSEEGQQRIRDMGIDPETGEVIDDEVIDPELGDPDTGARIDEPLIDDADPVEPAVVDPVDPVEVE